MAASHALAGGHRSSAPSFFARLRQAPALHRQRRALAQLDDRALRDLGLTRQDAHMEAARPFWDVPGHWMV